LVHSLEQCRAAEFRGYECRRRSARGIVVGGDEIRLGLECDGICIMLCAKEYSGREAGDGAAGTEPKITGNGAGTGIGNGRSRENGKASGCTKVDHRGTSRKCSIPNHPHDSEQ